MNYKGDFTTADTVYFPFHTFDAAGASVTITGLAVTDIEVYKNGGTTQRASDSGYTLLDTDGIDFDGLTGIHGFSIDLSDNTDAGFFAAGNDYFVVVSSITVDGSTVSFVAGEFSIENRVAAALGAQAKLDVNAECDTALTDYDPPTKAELDSGLAALNDPTAAAIADAVWDEAKAGHVGAGSFGEEVQAHALSTEISALNDLSAAQVNAEVDTALADYDPPTKAELDAGLAALNDPTAAAIADAVWDEAKAGHVSAGSFGEEVQAHALSTEISALNDPTAAAIATAVLAEAVEGSLDVTEVLRIILAFAAGKTAGGSTTSITFRDQADTKDRITMTVDGDGDRSAVTVDGT